MNDPPLPSRKRSRHSSALRSESDRSSDKEREPKRIADHQQHHLGPTSVENQVVAFQINVALKRDLLETYWCDVGFAYDDMPPTHWDAKFEAYGGRLEGMDPVDEIMFGVFVALGALMSPNLPVIDSDVPRWISGDPTTKPIVGMELAGKQRMLTCTSLATQALYSMTQAGVFICATVRNLEMLQWAQLLNEFVLREPSTSLLIREASSNHIRLARAGVFHLEPDEYEFMTSKAADALAYDDAVSSAAHRTHCVFVKEEINEWYTSSSAPLDSKNITFLPSGAPKLSDADMRNEFQRVLGACYRKIGATHRNFVERLGNPHAVLGPKMDTKAAKDIFKEINNIVECSKQLGSLLAPWFFPQKPAAELVAQVKLCQVNATTLDFLIADLVEKRLDTISIGPKSDAGLKRLADESRKRKKKQLQVFADACGYFLANCGNKAVWLLQAFASLAAALPDWPAAVVTSDLTVQEKIHFRDGARVASWCSNICSDEQFSKMSKGVPDLSQHRIDKLGPTLSQPRRAGGTPAPRRASTDSFLTSTVTSSPANFPMYPLPPLPLATNGGPAQFPIGYAATTSPPDQAPEPGEEEDEFPELADAARDVMMRVAWWQDGLARSPPLQVDSPVCSPEGFQVPVGMSAVGGGSDVVLASQWVSGYST